MSGPREEWLVEAVIDQAAEWFSRHRNGEGLTTQDQNDFLDWLRTSPLHVHGYLEVARLAVVLPEALAGLDDKIGQRAVNLCEAAVPNNVVSLPALAIEGVPALAQSSPTRWRLGRVFGMATVSAVISCFLAIVTGDVSQLWNGPEQVFAASYPKVRTVQFQDGSTVYLNSGSEIRVRYSSSARLVELAQGEALFSVVHDRTRPFRVRSGGAEIVDIGTQFDVNRVAGRTTVTVLQGEAEVLQHGTLHLRAGQQVQVGSAVTEPHIVTADARHVTDWLHRNISFDNRPLGEVIRQINRYASVRIVIEEPSLRKLRVNGVLDAYDTRSLLLFLQQYGEIERATWAIIVRSRKPGPSVKIKRSGTTSTSTTRT